MNKTRYSSFGLGRLIAGLIQGGLGSFEMFPAKEVAHEIQESTARLTQLMTVSRLSPAYLTLIQAAGGSAHHFMSLSRSKIVPSETGNALLRGFMAAEDRLLTNIEQGKRYKSPLFPWHEPVNNELEIAVLHNTLTTLATDWYRWYYGILEIGPQLAELFRSKQIQDEYHQFMEFLYAMVLKCLLFISSKTSQEALSTIHSIPRGLKVVLNSFNRVAESAALKTIVMFQDGSLSLWNAWRNCPRERKLHKMTTESLYLSSKLFLTKAGAVTGMIEHSKETIMIVDELNHALAIAMDLQNLGKLAVKKYRSREGQETLTPDFDDRISKSEHEGMSKRLIDMCKLSIKCQLLVLEGDGFIEKEPSLLKYTLDLAEAVMMLESSVYLQQLKSKYMKAFDVARRIPAAKINALFEEAMGNTNFSAFAENFF